MRGTWDGRADEQRRAYGESKNIPKNWAGAKSQYAKATQAPKGGANANAKTWSGTGQDSDDDSFFTKAAVREGRGRHATSCVSCIPNSFIPCSSHLSLHYTYACIYTLLAYICTHLISTDTILTCIYTVSTCTYSLLYHTDTLQLLVTLSLFCSNSRSLKLVPILKCLTLTDTTHGAALEQHRKKRVMMKVIHQAFFSLFS